MKKTVFTLFSSFIIIMAILVSDYTINKNFKVVKTGKIVKEQIVKYISAEGTVKEQNKREIMVELPFKIEDVYIEVGDKISKDAKLFKLDKEVLKNKMELNTVTSSQNNENLMAKINNYNTYVTSPINGIVTKINVKKGDNININLPVAVISDLDNLVIKAKVPENIVADIFEGQNAIIKGKSFYGEINGVVTKIHPVAETIVERGYQSYITVDIKAEDYKNIKPETNVDIEFEKKSKDKTIVLPFDCVMFDEEIPYVFVNRYGYAVKKYVNLGEEFETTVEIINGVSEEDKVILNPKSDNITNGSKLKEIK